MADEELDLDIDEGGEGAGTNVKLFIFIGIGAVVVIVIAVVLFLLLGGEEEAPQLDENGEPIVEEVEEEEPKDGKMPAIYVRIKDPFVVNLRSSKRDRYLQVHIQFLTRSESAESAVTNNLPLLKDGIMTTLSRSNADALKQIEEREALRNRVLKKVQNIMEEEVGDVSIEKVLFTGFVIQ